MYFPKHKKRVIKIECVATCLYIIATLFKYIITQNNFDIILFYDLFIDATLGIIIYNIIYAIRKGD